MEAVSTRVYRKRKAMGLCPVCGGERDDKHRSLCNNCLIYRRENYAKRCETQTPEEKKRVRLQKAQTQYARNQKLRQQGLCVRCGAVSPLHWLCEVCYAKRKEWEAQHEDT